MWEKVKHLAIELGLLLTMVLVSLLWGYFPPVLFPYIYSILVTLLGVKLAVRARSWAIEIGLLTDLLPKS